jgi:hypothetical protein
VVMKMAEGDDFEEVKEDHKIKCQMSNIKGMSNDLMSNVKLFGHPVRMG